jgi:hypothetical protein
MSLATPEKIRILQRKLYRGARDCVMHRAEERAVIWLSCSIGSVVACCRGAVDYNRSGVLRRDAAGCFGSSRQA